MGIKGIYKELGPGKRVALSKLAADHIVNSDRPFRLAIDFAIWQFQAQAARGGTNPAIRTLFYRLARLLGTPIQPIFVFDGPEKPVFKRNKRSGRGDSLAAAQAKRLIRLFGFVVHDAPGEAEAECALLQKRGTVDAVLSEDVDTIMFGCTKTLRNWSAEGKSSKSPTHVSMYDVNDHDLNMAGLGLDREGMVLVALMSGGDYLPEGVPGCGVKVACEAAKAGFGKSICKLKTSDQNGIKAWRESLVHELHTNEKGSFRTKHKALSIPDDFPNLAILRYYTHPKVSPESILDQIGRDMNNKRQVQIDELREFTRETFGWDFKIGAIKFIRVLSEPLLVDKLHFRQPDAADCVKKISNRRAAFSTDGTPELRLSYIPQDVVPVDLSKEVEEVVSFSRDGLALNSDDEFEPPAGSLDAASTEHQPAAGKVFDATKPNQTWVLEEVVKGALPEVVSAWEESQLAKTQRKSPSKTKKAPAKSKKSTGMPRGALDQFVHIGKSVSDGIASDIIVAKVDKLPASKLDVPEHPKTPPRLSSKPSLPSNTAAGSTFKQYADRAIASSPVTPRTTIFAATRPGTIVISSSPASAPASSPAPASPSVSPPDPPRSPDARDEEAPAYVYPVLSPSGPSKAVRKQGTALAQIKVAAKGSTPQLTKGRMMKQTSMDMYAKRLFPTRAGTKTALSNNATQNTTPIELDEPEAWSSDLEPISSLMASPPPRQRAPRSIHSPTPGPQHKKRILVPRSSAVGFFKEVEVETAQLDGFLHEEAGGLQGKSDRQRAVRWSDVSVVDLTGDT